MDIKQFLVAIKQIAEEKGIPENSVLETVEAAIAAAYKREYGKKGQIIKAKLDPGTGDVQFWLVKIDHLNFLKIEIHSRNVHIKYPVEILQGNVCSKPTRKVYRFSDVRSQNNVFLQKRSQAGC